MLYVTCTKEKPWDGKERPVHHVDAREVHDSQEDGWPGGDTVTMECPHCKHRWTRELAQ